MAAAACWLAGLGCLFTPPIEQRPEELDVPPEFNREDIRPFPPGRTVLLDRGDEEPEEFGLMEVRDRNLGDEIRFRYELEIDARLVLEPSGGFGVLDIDEAATARRGVTVYEPVLLRVNPCSEELRLAESLTVSLTLIDALPPSQFDPENPRLAYELPVVWNVRFTADPCPSGPGGGL
jgi:hypothetical protein